MHENKKIINDKEQEVVYVLSDKNLIIQNFTSNAQKILMLNKNFDLNNNNSNFITELNDDLIKEFESKVGKEKEREESKNKNSRKRITSFIKSDILKKYNYLEKNSVKVIHWKTIEVIKINNSSSKNLNYDDNNNETSSLSTKNPNKRKSAENILSLELAKIKIKIRKIIIEIHHL